MAWDEKVTIKQQGSGDESKRCQAESLCTRDCTSSNKVRGKAKAWQFNLRRTSYQVAI